MDRRETGSDFSNIAMLSTHGYFDPVPHLGQTDTGGQVVYVLELARALSAYDIKVDIYTRWFDKAREQIDPVPDYPDVRVVRIPAGQWEFIPKERIYPVLPELAKNMVKFINKERINYDLFHGHYVDAGIVMLDVAGEFNKPSFFTSHSLGAWKREQMGGDPGEMDAKYNFTHRIAEELRIFRTVAGQTATTEIQKEKIEELYGFNTENVTVIPPGVNTTRFAPPAGGQEIKIPDLPETYLFCLSRIDTNKGHDLLLNAFDVVRKEMPDVHLIIGGGSPEPQQTEREVLDSIKGIIDRKKMEDRVHLIGYVPDELLVSYYQHAAAFVLPSIFEPFGMTSQEAMACSTPVIASRLGGIREVITSGENGILIDPSDADEFAEAIINLLKDKRLLTQMGQKACDYIRQHYSWDAIARRFIDFYMKYL